jgi:hypothetical protein
MSSKNNKSLENYLTLEENAKKWKKIFFGNIIIAAFFFLAIICLKIPFYNGYFIYLSVAAFIYLLSFIKLTRYQNWAAPAKKVCMDELLAELLDKGFYAAECNPNDEAVLLIIKQHMADAIRENAISAYRREIEFLEKL